MSDPIEDARNYLRSALGALMEVANAEKRSRDRVEMDFIDMLESLPTDCQRLDVLGHVYERFCRECGGKQPMLGSCNCWNDE